MVGGGVCKVIFMSNPTVELRLGWGFDNTMNKTKPEDVLFFWFIDVLSKYDS